MRPFHLQPPLRQSSIEIRLELLDREHGCFYGAGVMASRKASATACSITVPPTLRQYTPRPLTRSLPASPGVPPKVSGCLVITALGIAARLFCSALVVAGRSGLLAVAHGLQFVEQRVQAFWVNIRG